VSAVTLYREIDALGGSGMPSEGENWSRGYSEALSDVLSILSRRGFSEHHSPVTDLVSALTPILSDIGQAGADGWTNGYVHTTDLDRLQQAIAQVSA